MKNQTICRLGRNRFCTKAQEKGLSDLQNLIRLGWLFRQVCLYIYLYIQTCFVIVVFRRVSCAARSLVRGTPVSPPSSSTSRLSTCRTCTASQEHPATTTRDTVMFSRSVARYVRHICTYTVRKVLEDFAVRVCDWGRYCKALCDV